MTRENQMFPFLSPLLMLPYATSPTAAHGAGTQNLGCAGGGLVGLFGALCPVRGAVGRAGHAEHAAGEHMAPGQHLCAAQCWHPGVVLAAGTGALSVWKCSRVVPPGLLLCCCLMAFTCRGCVAVCEHRSVGATLCSQCQAALG